jgi:galactarate dehydratase
VRPLYVRVHETDNVAIIVNPEGLPSGTLFESGLELRESVPQSHKVALRDIDSGEAVLRYGQVIGLAARAIPRGSWVREELVKLPVAPELDALPLCTAIPPPLPPLEGMTFEGFRNADGTAGTRNILGITTTVQCVAPTVEHAVARVKREILPRYPGVADVVALTHDYGCGVAIDAPGAEIPVRTIRNLSRHPNLGGEPLTVSLGCEKLQPERLFPEGIGLPRRDEQPFVIRLQDEGHAGFGDMVAEIMRAVERSLAVLNARCRVSCPVSDLVVGLQCGGSDAFSGVSANPAVGHAADLLVRAGASVIFSEVTEVRDAVHLLTPRANSVDVARGLVREMRWFDDYLGRGMADRSANPTPGNKRGGLANVVEKALGSVAKSGSSPLVAVSGPGERVTAKGLVFAATPASDFICGTLQLAAGMNMHVFTTGEGSPYGLAMAPVLKVSSRTSLAERWHDLIDVDAGRIATGAASIETVGREIFELILDVASGRKRAWAERHGLANPLALFMPGPVT